jgi:hypothetical protein
VKKGQSPAANWSLRLIRLIPCLVNSNK